MNDNVRRMHGERGASLILAIAFMVVIGAISAAVISTTASGIQDRVVLDQARNREYAADGAIESMIAAARGSGGTCPAPTNFPSMNGVSIHAECTSTPAVVVGPGGVLLTQDDLTFVACESSATCTSTIPPPNPNTNPIITSLVNFQGAAPSKSFVLSWSVNR
jgi:type II secretory pathway pseudopilin PulG